MNQTEKQKYPIGSFWRTENGKHAIIISHGINVLMVFIEEDSIHLSYLPDGKPMHALYRDLGYSLSEPLKDTAALGESNQPTNAS